jgi:hypothetical protein
MIFVFMLIMLSFICFFAAILTEIFTIFCLIYSFESIIVMMRKWRLFVKFWNSFITIQKETLNEFWLIFIVFMIKKRIIEFNRVMTDVMSSSFEKSWNDDSSSEIILLFVAIMFSNALMICFLITFMQVDKICKMKKSTDRGTPLWLPGHSPPDTGTLPFG